LWTVTFFIQDPIFDVVIELTEIWIRHYSEVTATDVEMEGVEKVKLRMVIGKDEGAPNFIMRIFEVEPGGHTPFHAHEWEHENFVMDGEGLLVMPDGSKRRLKPGDVAFVPPNVKHQYRNESDELFRFICLVPRDD
jgi:quercetin dioxygenase-like cupin family protein